MSNKRGVFSWCLFDWAHAAYPTLVTTFIFSTYLTKSVAPNVALGTSYFAYALAIAGVTMAILSPVLGSIADSGRFRKSWLGFFVICVIVLTMLLWWVQPHANWLMYGLVVFTLAQICYELTQVFYNSLLVGLVSDNMIGRISGWGWGLGYLGANFCLIVALVFFIKGHFISHEQALNVRSTMFLVAAWFAVFCLPLFLFTPDNNQTRGKPLLSAIGTGLSELGDTLKSLRQHRNIFTYLLAHLLYIDGVNTLLAFVGIYAMGSLHFSFAHLIVFAIAANCAGAIGAALLACFDNGQRSKAIVQLCLLGIIVFGVCILAIPSVNVFWVCGLLASFFVGAVQASSRSLMVHLMGKSQVSQMFGLYNMSGRLTAFIGPLFVGLMTTWFGSQRLGLSITIVLMVLGFVALFWVKRNAEISFH